MFTQTVFAVKYIPRKDREDLSRHSSRKKVIKTKDEVSSHSEGGKRPERTRSASPVKPLSVHTVCQPAAN